MSTTDWSNIYSLQNYATRYGKYFIVSLTVFIIGIIAGIASGSQLLPLIENVIPVSSPTHSMMESVDFFEEFTTSSIFINNVQAFFLSLLGFISGGLASVASLLLNGMLVGLVVFVASQELSLLTILSLLLPHGILEISAFSMSGAITIRFTHQIIKAFKGERKTIITTYEIVEILVIIMVVVVLLFVAAWIEVNITPDIGMYIVENYE